MFMDRPCIVCAFGMKLHSLAMHLLWNKLCEDARCVAIWKSFVCIRIGFVWFVMARSGFFMCVCVCSVLRICTEVRWFVWICNGLLWICNCVCSDLLDLGCLT